jgi:hypothetical protein
MAVVSILTRKFNSYYASKPGMPFSGYQEGVEQSLIEVFAVLTTMITNAVRFPPPIPQRTFGHYEHQY